MMGRDFLTDMNDYIPDSLDMLEEYERDRERRHRLYEKQARREEMADIESEEERIKERWKKSE
jgi:hypothetical protein